MYNLFLTLLDFGDNETFLNRGGANSVALVVLRLFFCFGRAGSLVLGLGFVLEPGRLLFLE